MGPTERLIQKLGQLGHPLALAVQPSEAAQLVEQLRMRLGDSGDQLDLSPASLSFLELKLVDYHRALLTTDGKLNDEALALLVRELAGYLGSVLVEHAAGRWATSRTLWGTEIAFDLPVNVVKDGVWRRSSGHSVFVGNMAAGAWDAIEAGVKPGLLKFYQSAKAKTLREKL